jgi:hypothetical protein
MRGAIRTLLPPGGFHNLVGHHVAALDAGLDALRVLARSVPPERLHDAPAAGVSSPAASLHAVGERESAWVHGAVGRVPTPPAPPARAPLDDLLGWLDAVRTVTLMVLRPLADRDLERLVDLPGVGAPTTLRRLLSDLQEHQGFRRGEITVAAALLRQPDLRAAAR